MAKDVKKEVEKHHKDFAEVVAGMSVGEMEKRALSYTKERENVKRSREEDEDLERCVNLKKELEAPYKDALKAIDLKIRYLFSMMEEKGGDVSGSGEHSPNG